MRSRRIGIRVILREKDKTEPAITDFEGGKEPQVKEDRQPLEARKGKKIYSLLELP